MPTEMIKSAKNQREWASYQFQIQNTDKMTKIPRPNYNMHEYSGRQNDAIAFPDDTTIETTGTVEIYPKL